MRRMRTAWVALTLGGALLALTPHSTLAQKRQRDRITQEEIEASAQKDLDLYQVVRSLRPHFVEPPKGVRSMRGNSAQAATAVFVDRRLDSGLDALKLIRPLDVEEVRYMDATQSANEFGPRFNGGALLIKMKKKATEKE